MQIVLFPNTDVYKIQLLIKYELCNLPLGLYVRTDGILCPAFAFALMFVS